VHGVHTGLWIFFLGGGVMDWVIDWASLNKKCFQLPPEGYNSLRRKFGGDSFLVNGPYHAIMSAITPTGGGGSYDIFNFGFGGAKTDNDQESISRISVSAEKNFLTNFLSTWSCVSRTHRWRLRSHILDVLIRVSEQDLGHKTEIPVAMTYICMDFMNIVCIFQTAC
jgi:hypothetical protein